MVITEVGEFWEIENWLLLLDLIVLVVEHFNEALSDEVHLLDIALVADDTLSWSGDTAIHLDDQFVSEASLTFLEEVVE